MAPLRLGRMTSGVLLPIAPIAPIADRVEYPVSVPVPRCNRMRSLIIPPVSRTIPRMDRVFPVVVSLSQDNDDWKRCLFVKCHPKTGMSILVYCTIILTSRALPDLVTLIVLVPVHRGKLQLCSRTRTRTRTRNSTGTRTISAHAPGIPVLGYIVPDPSLRGRVRFERVRFTI